MINGLIKRKERVTSTRRINSRMSFCGLEFVESIKLEKEFLYINLWFFALEILKNIAGLIYLWVKLKLLV